MYYTVEKNNTSVYDLSCPLELSYIVVDTRLAFNLATEAHLKLDVKDVWMGGRVEDLYYE